MIYACHLPECNITILQVYLVSKELCRFFLDEGLEIGVVVTALATSMSLMIQENIFSTKQHPKYLTT